jgi:hypothetical protein
MNNMPQTVPFDFNLTASGPASMAAIKLGCTSFSEIAETIAALDYKRNINKNDLLCVLDESCGTCSTKHVYLKTILEEHHIENVALIIGIFNMNAINTPKITAVLNKYGLDGIPEAHCYLKYNNTIYDFTFAKTQLNVVPYLFREISVSAKDIAFEKIKVHQQFIQQWIFDNKINYPFETIWKIREDCILALSE